VRAIRRVHKSKERLPTRADSLARNEAGRQVVNKAQASLYGTLQEQNQEKCSA
jgi:hypothetical protein